MKQRFEYKFYIFKKPLKVIIEANNETEADLEFNIFLKKNLKIVSKVKLIESDSNPFDIFKDIYK